MTGIVGVRRRRVRFEGQADHAGTTPMAMRRDAGMAMLAFALSAAKTLRDAGSAASVWNLGVVGVKPGAANVVPDEAEIVVEFRDLSTAVLDRMDEALGALIARKRRSDGVCVTSARDRRGSSRPIWTSVSQFVSKPLPPTRGRAQRADAKRSRPRRDDRRPADPRRDAVRPEHRRQKPHMSEDTDEGDIRRGLQSLRAGGTVDRSRRSGPTDVARSDRID